MPVATARASRPRDARVPSYSKRYRLVSGSLDVLVVPRQSFEVAERRVEGRKRDPRAQSGPLAPLWLQIWSVVVGEGRCDYKYRSGSDRVVRALDYLPSHPLPDSGVAVEKDELSKFKLSKEMRDTE